MMATSVYRMHALCAERPTNAPEKTTNVESDRRNRGRLLA
jgi:hypothetical protein